MDNTEVFRMLKRIVADNGNFVSKEKAQECLDELKEKTESLDAFGGWLIGTKAPTVVLDHFREARK